MSKSGWHRSGRRQELPKDWQKLRALARVRADGRCEHVSSSGARCKRRGTDLDHAFNRDNHSLHALQWLCPEHHKRKTAMESWAARLGAKTKGKRQRRDDNPSAL